MLTPVAGASVAEDLIADLDHLSMEEFANRSGRRHGGGYTEPTQAAWEMVEEVIERHLAELDRRVRLGRFEDAKLTCIGVLTGLYEYRTPKNGTVMSWANGAADELARQTLTRTRLAGVEVDDTDLRGLFSDWLVDP